MSHDDVASRCGERSGGWTEAVFHVPWKLQRWSRTAAGLPVPHHGAQRGPVECGQRDQPVRRREEKFITAVFGQQFLNPLFPLCHPSDSSTCWGKTRGWSAGLGLQSAPKLPARRPSAKVWMTRRPSCLSTPAGCRRGSSAFLCTA